MLYSLCIFGLFMLLRLNETPLEPFRVILFLGMVGLGKLLVWGLDARWKV